MDYGTKYNRDDYETDADSMDDEAIDEEGFDDTRFIPITDEGEGDYESFSTSTIDGKGNEKEKGILTAEEALRSFRQEGAGMFNSDEDRQILADWGIKNSGKGKGKGLSDEEIQRQLEVSERLRNIATTGKGDVDEFEEVEQLLRNEIVSETASMFSRDSAAFIPRSETKNAGFNRIMYY